MAASATTTWPFFLGLASGVGLATSASLSTFVTYLTWTSLVSWHIFDRHTSHQEAQDFTYHEDPHKNEVSLLRDPLVVGLIAIACLAALETANLVLCVWAGVNSAFRKNLRHVSPTSDSRQATSKGGWSAVPRILALNFITLSSAFQIATVAYLLLIDWRFPNLHKPATFGQHHHQGTASLTISKLKTKRPITTILHDHQPHQLALEEAMEIYRDYQPTLLAVYTLSVILKSLLMKFCPRSRQQGPGERVDEKKEGGDESNPLRGRVEMDSYLDSGDFYSHEDETKKNICSDEVSSIKEEHR